MRAATDSAVTTSRQVDFFTTCCKTALFRLQYVNNTTYYDTFILIAMAVIFFQFKLQLGNMTL